VTLVETSASSLKSATGKAVSLRGVSRRFGDVQAVRNLDLTAPEGRITILLGPNGAGKTTAVRIITGALTTDSGEVATLGLDPAHDGETVRQACGVVAAKPALYDRLSGYDNLAYAASLYDVPRPADKVIVDAARRFGIDDALDQLVGGYSTGMKTRLALARSILHSPGLLLLDEPTSGLDPESSQAVLELIKQMTANGTTVVMCTHHLAEAEGLADWIVMLEHGTALAQGDPDELITQLWPLQTLLIEAVEPHRLDVLAGFPGVVGYDRDGPASVQIESLDAVPGIVAELVGTGIQLTRVEPLDRTLSDLYFELRRLHR
jgi:ABC-2 type transport system ATP-binding protein